MKRLIMVGAGALGREILSWMLDTKAADLYDKIYFLLPFSSSKFI